jgi:hypothetical protein
MRLVPEQVQLLEAMVEAARTVPRTDQVFELISIQGFGERNPASISGGGLSASIPVLADDVWNLAYAGLLTGNPTNEHVARFTITADGFAYYESLRDRPSEPAAAVDDETRRYLDARAFRGRFPQAEARLRAAITLLWETSPAGNLTTVGHKLREAVQQFASELVEQHEPEGVDADPAHTNNRLRAVIEMHRESLGEKRSELLDALVGYQDAVNGVIQRLAHGDQKLGDPLTWNDARTAVFQTVNMMCEFDRILHTP